jgi:transposase
MKSKVKQLDYTGVNIYCGIDTHLKNWRVTILVEEVFFKTISIDPKAEVLSNFLKKNFPNGEYFSAYEAGFCGYSVHRNLQNKGITNIIVNAADIPTTDKERKQKEDNRDSRKIARSLRNGDLGPIYIPTPATEELRSFVRYRRSLVKDIGRNKSRIKSFLYRHGIDIPIGLNTASRYWSANFSKWLKTLRLTTDFGHTVLLNTLLTVEQLRERLLGVEKELRKISKQQIYAKQFDCLTSIPGIGLISAMIIISEIESIKRFSNLNKLCSYVGLVPTTNSSGEDEKSGNITPRSNKPLRSILIECAWIAIRHDSSLTLAYSKLSSRMKANKAIIRIAKKLLARIKYVLEHQEIYEYAKV